MYDIYLHGCVHTIRFLIHIIYMYTYRYVRYNLILQYGSAVEVMCEFDNHPWKG